MRKTTSISVTGDRDYVGQLNALAAVRRKCVGDLVREALDKVYSDDLSELSFFATRGTQKFQSGSRTEEAEVTA